jgi:hypothetical protein
MGKTELIEIQHSRDVNIYIYIYIDVMYHMCKIIKKDKLHHDNFSSFLTGTQEESSCSSC